MVATPDALRTQLATLLSWHDAHADFDAAVEGLPAALRGRAPAGLPYSPWQLVEHLRITQRDILDFCRNPAYEELRWPDNYWPDHPAPPSPAAWDESLALFRRDRDALRTLAEDRSIDLLATIPHGSGQTYLRELLLVADHNAYHIGQLIAVRRLLGAWGE
jgi:DinB family protein